MSGTQGRVYGGDPGLIHIPDGRRAEFGRKVASFLTDQMHHLDAGISWTPNGRYKPLCPGCYMVALVNAAIELADRNGQSRKELGLSMANAFSRLAAGGPMVREEIEVILDPEEDDNVECPI